MTAKPLIKIPQPRNQVHPLPPAPKKSNNNSTRGKKYKKKPIPAALKQAVWIFYNGKIFESKCYTTWCQNCVNVFSFEAGHDVPESKGGHMSLENLRPICSSCNKSMGNRHTIAEFSNLYGDNTARADPLPAKPAKTYKKWWHRFMIMRKSTQSSS
jgi:5-methylcytosine-specific restriction endonuclease McrA